jgi:uncharacterized protein YjbI with pentapeptide repeats
MVDLSSEVPVTENEIHPNAELQGITFPDCTDLQEANLSSASLSEVILDVADLILSAVIT